MMTKFDFLYALGKSALSTLLVAFMFKLTVSVAILSGMLAFPLVLVVDLWMKEPTEGQEKKK